LEPYREGNQARPELNQEKQDEKQKRTKGQETIQEWQKDGHDFRGCKTGKSDSEAKRTIKQLVIETLSANSSATNDEMIAAVKKEFPKSAFKDTHAAWYRSQARRDCLQVRPLKFRLSDNPNPAMTDGLFGRTAAQVCRETATEFSNMKKFENVLPRYRIVLVKESEDSFTSYPKFQNSRELFDCFREELRHSTASISS